MTLLRESREKSVSGKNSSRLYATSRRTRTARERFRLKPLSSNPFQECIPLNDAWYCFGYLHFAYLAVPKYQVTYTTLPCERLSRSPW